MTTVQVFNSDDPPTLYRYNGQRVCGCGHPTLDELVPVGKFYDAWPESIHRMGLKCGGCGITHHVQAIAVARERGNPACGYGFLPLDVLERVEVAEGSPA